MGLLDLYNSGSTTLNIILTDLTTSYPSTNTGTPTTYANPGGPIIPFHQLYTDDSDTDTEASIKYHKYHPNNNTLDVNLPHRESHSEPGLGNEIRETFLRDRTNKWRIDNTIVPTIPEINFDMCKDLPIYSYIRMVDWIVLEKI